MRRAWGLGVVLTLIAAGCTGGGTDDSSTSGTDGESAPPTTDERPGPSSGDSTTLPPGDLLDAIELATVSAAGASWDEIETSLVGDVITGLSELGVTVPASAFQVPDESPVQPALLVDILGAVLTRNVPPPAEQPTDAAPVGFAGPVGPVKRVERGVPAGTLQRPDRGQFISGVIGWAGGNLSVTTTAPDGFDTGHHTIGVDLGNGLEATATLQSTHQGNRATSAAGFGMSSTSAIDGQSVTTQFRAEATLSSDLCPDAAGIVRVDFHVTAASSGNVAGAGFSASKFTIDGTAVITVDDSAEIAGIEIDVNASRGSNTTTAYGDVRVIEVLEVPPSDGGEPADGQAASDADTAAGTGPITLTIGEVVEVTSEPADPGHLVLTFEGVTEVFPGEGGGTDTNSGTGGESGPITVTIGEVTEVFPDDGPGSLTVTIGDVVEVFTDDAATDGADPAADGDAGGTLELRFAESVESTPGSDDGSGGQTVELEVVDVIETTPTAGSPADSPQGPSSYVEGQWHVIIPADSDIAEVTGEVVRNSSQATQADAADTFSQMLDGSVAAVQAVITRARDYWQHGNCVQLQIEAPAKAKPSSKHEIKATVRHVVEGVELELPVTAAVTAGGESIDPSEASGKPAQFTYTAPDKGGVTATVSFEVRSRRGADQKTVSIEIRDNVWIASSEGGRISISGTVTDIAAPFTLHGVFQGGEAELTFTPADEQSGSYTFTASGSGATGSGGGSYTMVGNEDEAYTLTYTGSGCVANGFCSETNGVIILSPQDAD